MSSTVAERKRAQRARWRSEGRCTGCGSPDRAKRGRVTLATCETCLTSSVERMRASRERRQLNNLMPSPITE